jgi:hypothetical protein
MQEIRKIRPNHGSCVNCVNPEHMKHIDVLRNHHSRTTEFISARQNVDPARKKARITDRAPVLRQSTCGEEFVRVRRGGITGT